MSVDRWEQWRDQFVPVGGVPREDPRWIVPGLVVPGLMLIVAPPKHHKSLAFLHIVAALLKLKSFREKGSGMIAKHPGTCVYFPAEQGRGTIRRIFEDDVLKKKIIRPSWDFVIPKFTPSKWRLDEEEGAENFQTLIRDTKPTVLGLDPLVYFHRQDENDPRLVDPILPVKEAMQGYGGALVLVHHANKGNGDQGGKMGFDRVRGTSALWAAADGCILLNKVRKGVVSVVTEFKEHPGSTFTWRPYG